MPLRYNGTTIGKVVIKQDLPETGWKKFTIQIRQGNCLAVLIHVRKSTPEELAKHPEGKYLHTLYTFYSDSTHMANLIKHEGDVQTSETALQKVHLGVVDRNGFVELKWKEKDNGLKMSNWILEEQR
jgi:hypothetical protein